MSDEPTMGELSRRLESFDRRITEVASRSVDGAVYAVEIRSLRAAQDELKATVVANQNKLASQRLMFLTGLIFPVLVAIITAVIFAALGAR